MCSTRHPGDVGIPTFLTHAQQLEKRPPCEAHCPNTGDVRGWIGIIAQRGKNGLTLDEAYDAAWEKLAQLNPLPATISRICPHPCEARCSRGEKDGAVSINALERFLGDWGLRRSLSLPMIGSGPYPESIGVVGSGPASLSFAYQMARRGYRVVIYEQHEEPGGMLRVAIPDYRLPKEVLGAEIDRLLELGVELRSGVDVGVSIDVATLREKHALTFFGVGAQAARRLGIPGENGPGVISGIEYLKHRRERRETLQGRKVVVIGGGNTAIDAARGALRDGADVTLVYRRSAAEMPASGHEVDDARDEGVDFRFLSQPVAILRDGDRVRHIDIQAMQLGETDANGRRQPVPKDEPVSRIEADLVIVAVAQAPDWHGLETLVTSSAWLAPRQDGRLGDGLWAGGDDRGPGIASAAIAQGRLAAEAAHAELRGLPPPRADARTDISSGSVKSGYFENRARRPKLRRPRREWLENPEAEIDQTISSEHALGEAMRCMSCGLCFDCQQCFMYCNRAGFTRVEETGPGKYYALDLDACEGCGKCIEVCPCGYLESRAR